MTATVVFVHGIRTSATMWRSQVEHLAARGVGAIAVDLPGHGKRASEQYVLEEAFASIDAAVREAAKSGPTVLVGHSMGGLLTCAYMGTVRDAPVDAFVAASCTAFPRGIALSAYRLLARGFNALPNHGAWLTDRTLRLTLPEATREDFGAGGYAHHSQDAALSSLAGLDFRALLPQISAPTWFVNGEYDQLRLNERAFMRLVPQAELVVIPKATHLVTAMRPEAFNAVLDLAVATATSKQKSQLAD